MKTEEPEEEKTYKSKRESCQCDGCGNKIKSNTKIRIDNDLPARLCDKCLVFWKIYGSGKSLEAKNEQRTFAKT